MHSAVQLASTCQHLVLGTKAITIRISKKGDLAASFASLGLQNVLAVKSDIAMPFAVVLQSGGTINNAYISEIPAIYTSKPDKRGKAVQKR